MQGCIQRVFFGDVNAATRAGADRRGLGGPRAPLTPLLRRAADARGRRGGVAPLAQPTIAAYEGYDKIVANVAGCGWAMKDYGHILGRPDRRARVLREGRRRARAARAEEPQAVRHPIELTRRLPRRLPPRPRPEDPHPAARAAARHPRPGAARAAEWELCCGSAGIYNLLQPEAAAKLGARKADNLRETGAEAIAAANPGCALQIGKHLDLPIYHPMTLLDHSLRGAAIVSSLDAAAPPDEKSRRDPLRRGARLRVRAARALQRAPRGAPAGARRARQAVRVPGGDRGRSATATGRSRRRGPTTRTGARRSPARPTASSSSTRSTAAPRASWPTSRTRTRRPGPTRSRAT